MSGRPLHGQITGVSDDPVNPGAGKDRLLDDALAFALLKKSPAGVGVFPFGVLPHHDEINILRAALSQRRADSLQKPDRAKVDILVETAPDRQQQSPERDVIGHRRIAHRPEQDGVKRGKLLDAVLGHHLAMLEIV